MREVSVSEAQASALEAHYQLLVHWNRVLNLTSIRSLEEAVVRHYAECVYFSDLLPPVETVLDFGSGGGFPGIPIAVMRPECRVTLLESHQRKAVFLREATRGMPNVSVVSQRAEDARGSWDLVVSRAVNPAEVAAQLPRLARRVALLAGEFPASPPAGIQWADPIKLPWGENRFVVMGDVPRGT